MPGSGGADEDAAATRPGHHQQDPAAPADAQRELVAENRRGHREQVDDGGDRRQLPREAVAGVQRRRKGEERHHPAARAEKLEAMRHVSGGVACRGAIAKHLSPRGEGKQGGRRFLGRADGHRFEQQKNQRSGNDRPCGRDHERHAPSRARSDEAGGGERKRGADAEERRVGGDRSALPRPRDAVGKQAQARHVGRGEADAEQYLEENRAGESAGSEPEAHARGRRDQAAGEIDAARVDAVGERGPVGDGDDVAREEHAADDARLRVREMPGIAQLGQQRGVGGEAHHRGDVGRQQDGGGANGS